MVPQGEHKEGIPRHVCQMQSAEVKNEILESSGRNNSGYPENKKDQCGLRLFVRNGGTLKDKRAI